MTWNYDDSLARVRKHLDEMGEIEIKPMVREMDLEHLSETVCRDIFGAHVYCDIANLSALVGTSTDKARRQRLVQALHIYQREVARIADEVGAVRIHFQGARVHLLLYRPIQDSKEIATKTVLAQLMIDRFGQIFSTRFTDLPDLRIRSGSDLGNAVGTRNGSRGDRELLFLGSPANHAAKLLPEGGDRRLTGSVYDELPEDLAAYVEDDLAQYRLRRPDSDDLESLLADHGVAWSADEAEERLDEDLEQFPADKVELWGASSRIDFDTLSFTNGKLVEAATLFGDVSGFTAYIDGTRYSEEARRQALREFHAIRREMAEVVKKDHEGVRVQFQGDRIQGLFQLPEKDSDGFSQEAVSAAVGLQSSFELVLKALLPNIAILGLAVGISQGTTIATKLGERGHRDRICLGADVLRAEANEERVGKYEIGISGNVRDHLPEELAERFVWDASKGCFVASGLNQGTLDLVEASKAYRQNQPVYVKPAASGVVIGTKPDQGRRVEPSRPWSA